MQVQRLFGLKADGIVGAITLGVLNGTNPKDVFEKIHAKRIDFVDNIVRNNPSQSRFIKGWKNRINSIKFEL